MNTKSESASSRTDDVIAKIAIPVGTRLQGLVRGYFEGQIGWQVWIAINNPKLAAQKWIGTFLFCGDNGCVIRVTINPDGTEDHFYVKYADTR